MAKAYVFIAQGFEEMELTISVDILRRAGIEVQLVTLNSHLNPVKGSNGIGMVPDIQLSDLDWKASDLLVLPGGLEGTKNLAANDRILEILKQANKAGKTIGAICAAPTILVKAGIVEGKQLTSHPGMVDQMPKPGYKKSRVVCDGNIVTSRAAGTSFEFAFALVEKIVGSKKVKEVNKGVLAILPDQLPDLMS